MAKQSEENLTNQNYLMKINDIYYELTSSEKRVADIIISNAGRVQHMTATELAKGMQCCQCDDLPFLQ
jgi:DNA-binding MurR/RpiR family transcriptional regulator